MITTEELKNWLQQDTTKYFLKSLYNQRELLKEELAKLDCQHGDFMRGQIKTIQNIIEIDPEQIIENFVYTVDKYYAEEFAVKEEEGEEKK